MQQPQPDLGQPSFAISTGGRIFLLSSFSHDDLDQWPLIPHWFQHYLGLGLHPENFLLILHSDSKNVSGVRRMADQLRVRYRVAHIFPDLLPYSARRHHALKMKILMQYVREIDWVMQADADELVLFPGHRSAVTALEFCERIGATAFIGMLVDRVATHGDLHRAVTAKPSLFDQYPLNCAMTILLQGSDARKVSAYRGSLRTCSGNHNVIGYNDTTARKLATAAPLGREWIMKKLLGSLRKAVGDSVFRHFPSRLGLVRVPTSMASVFHFKWTRGIEEKLWRRVDTEPSTSSAYEQVRSIPMGAKLDRESVNTCCLGSDPSGTAPRALEAWELAMLLTGGATNFARLHFSLKFGIARETDGPFM